MLERSAFSKHSQQTALCQIFHMNPASFLPLLLIHIVDHLKWKFLGKMFTHLVWASKSCNCFLQMLGDSGNLDWKEVLSGIPQGTWDALGYSPSSHVPVISGDILRSAILWNLWCARCRFIFVNEQINVYQACHSAWRDTIHAGMAIRNHYLSFYENCGERRKAQILLEFSLDWCTNNVFCSGDLFSPKWKLAPYLTGPPPLAGGLV
jgi:hypothetical protein